MIKRILQTLNEIEKNKTRAPSYFVVTCTIQSISDGNYYYTGCPKCRRKINIKESDGKCPHCSKNYDELLYIYIYSVLIADGSSQCWVQAFSDVGEKLLGK